MIETLDPVNPLWQFSCAVYARLDVRDECLAAQDEHDADVNLLLFCAWLGAARRVQLTGRQLEAAMEVASGWHTDVVRPLRAVRRALKMRPESAAAMVQDLRKRVAADELAAEQVEQALLYAHAEKARLPASDASPAACVRSNIEAYLRPLGSSSDSCPVLRAAAVALAGEGGDRPS